MADTGESISVKEAQKILASNDSNQRLESKSLSITLESKGGASMKSRDGSAYLDYLGQFYSPLAPGGSFYKGLQEMHWKNDKVVQMGGRMQQHLLSGQEEEEKPG